MLRLSGVISYLLVTLDMKIIVICFIVILRSDQLLLPNLLKKTLFSVKLIRKRRPN